MFKQLKEMICEFVEIEEEKITMEAKLIEDLGFNSYDLMCLIGEIEERLDIEISEQDAVNLRTVQEVVDYISAQVA
ncbi:MAG: acyl carrier protein [Cellulosilyticum sp.]|nr:acyl carrier protein [Cellulosilyticum sp.]